MHRCHLIYFSLLLSVCMHGAHRTHAAQCRASDKAALLAFRKTFVTNPSAESDCNPYEWNDAVDCCSWEGIDCSSSTGSVVGLTINNPCSKGTLSSFSPTSSLFQLSSLQTLDLQGFNLQQSIIPKDIAKLSQLRTLRLIDANLSGPIPDSVGSLRSLQTLQLRQNSLAGTIPASFFRHQSLSELDLSFNELQGSLPGSITRPSNLTLMVLSNNLLVGTIPSWIFNIASLQTLDLSRNSLGPLQPFPKPAATSLGFVDLSFNKITGSLPSSLLQLTKVTSLNLQANQLTGVVEWNAFKNMISLAYLYLSFNRGLALRNAAGPPVLLPSFSYLDVRSCGLTEFPEFLSGFDGFSYLDVSDNRITRPVFQQKGWVTLGEFNGSHNQITSFDFPKENEFLHRFDMSYNSLKGPLPKPPSTLTLLVLSHNQLGGGIPSQYCNLTTIETLDLGFNNLKGVLPSCLMHASGEMKVLGLQNNRFHGAIPDTFGLAPSNQLNIIMLGNNKLQGPLPKSLSACKNLRVLDVGSNRISDAFPSWMAQIASLQILIISSNRFTGIISTKEKFSNLQILDASSNRFTGPLPTAIIQNLNYMVTSPAKVDYVGGTTYFGFNGNYRFLVSVDITVKGVKLKSYNVLNTLTIVDFSNNRFSGKIPPAFGNLKALKVLTLSQNRLSGQIPAAIGSMDLLESLDLSRNKLGGRIPANLMSLKNLQYLNLSYNNLQGPIPNGKFPSDSYIGNPGLCGPPLSKSCWK